MLRDNLNEIDRALAQVEGVLHLNHGGAVLDEDGKAFSPLDFAEAIHLIREARNLLGVTACPPVTVVPAREVIPNFWPTRDLSRFLDTSTRTHADPSTP